MKTTTTRGFIAVSILLAGMAILNGCATMGASSDEERLVATLKSVEADYHLAQQQTVVVEDALNELAVSDVLDLEQAFEAFSESVDRLEDTSERLVAHADEMMFQGPSYLVESGIPPTACVFPRRRVPEDRKAAELGDYFYLIAEEGWQAKRALRGYMVDITQIRDYLSTVLRPKGVDAMDPIIDKAQVDGMHLKESLAQVVGAIERAQAAKGATPPAPGPAGG